MCNKRNLVKYNEIIIRDLELYFIIQEKKKCAQQYYISMSPTHYSLIQITTPLLQKKKKNGTRDNLKSWFVVKTKFWIFFIDCLGLTIRIEYFGTSMYKCTILELLLYIGQSLATNLVVN